MRKSVHVQIMVDVGPMHARLLALGAEHMQQAKQRFLSEHEVVDLPVELRPCARRLVLRKPHSSL